MDGCAVLLHGDAGDGGLRRLQLHAPASVASALGRGDDARRLGHDRHCGGLRRRCASLPAAFAGHQPSACATYAQSPGGGRAGVVRDQGGIHAEAGRLPGCGDRTQRNQPRNQDGSRAEDCGHHRRRHSAEHVGGGPRRTRPGDRGADRPRHGQHRDRHRPAGDPRLGPVTARKAHPDRHADLRPRTGRCGGQPARLPIRPLHSRSGDTVVHRRGNGARGSRNILGGSKVVHGRRRRGPARKRVGRRADVRPVHPDPRHRNGTCRPR